jgi:peptide/nickel transport system permease protein
MSRLTDRFPRSFWFGTGIVVFFLLMAIIGPLFIGTPELGIGVAPVLKAPSAQYLFGTTTDGRNVFAEFIAGAGNTLAIAIIAGFLLSILSVVIGFVSGLRAGSIVDDVLSFVTQVFLVIPTLPLIIVAAGVVHKLGVTALIGAIAVLGWPYGARLFRSQTLSLRKRDFITAATMSGEPLRRLVFAELMPQEIPIVVSNFIFSVIAALLSETGLAFLGLASLPASNWGTMLNSAQANQALQLGAWWWFVPPGLAIALFGTGLVLMNYGIDAVANPRLRYSRSKAKSFAKDLEF